MEATEMLGTVSKVLTAMSRMLARAPESLSSEVLELWARVLAGAGLTSSEVERAARTILETEHFFPTPAKFIEAARPAVDDELAAEGAWLQVRELLGRYGSQASLCAADLAGDGAALWATERVGWERMGVEMTEENRSIFRAEFVRCYRHARRAGASLDYLAGRLERQNQGRELTPAMVGRLDWKEMPRGCPALAVPALPARREAA